MSRFDNRSRGSTYTQSWVGGEPDFGAFESIATTTVGVGGQTIIDFSNIPQIYKHLQVRCMLRDESAFSERALFMEINGNSPSGSNAYHQLLGNGSSASSTNATNQGRWSETISVSAASATAGIFAVAIIDILDYTNTNKTKTLRALGGYDANGSGKVMLTSYLYNSTNTISSLRFYTNQKMISSSHIALYGIKG